MINSLEHEKYKESSNIPPEHAKYVITVLHSFIPVDLMFLVTVAEYALVIIKLGKN
jgi:hypothetical protein